MIYTAIIHNCGRIYARDICRVATTRREIPISVPAIVNVTEKETVTDLISESIIGNAGLRNATSEKLHEVAFIASEAYLAK